MLRGPYIPIEESSDVEVKPHRYAVRNKETDQWHCWEEEVQQRKTKKNQKKLIFVENKRENKAITNR